MLPEKKPSTGWFIQVEDEEQSDDEYFCAPSYFEKTVL